MILRSCCCSLTAIGLVLGCEELRTCDEGRVSGLILIREQLGGRRHSSVHRVVSGCQSLCSGLGSQTAEFVLQC